MEREHPDGLLYGPPGRRGAGDSLRLRLESDLLHAIGIGDGWETVAALLEAHREAVLGEEWGRGLLELAAKALPVRGSYPKEAFDRELGSRKFGVVRLGDLPASEVELELREALESGRPLAPLSFGLPRALFANSNHLAAGRLLAARAARWEENVSIDIDPDAGLEEVFGVSEDARGAVWERSYDSVISATARCSYEERGRLLGRQLSRLVAGPDLQARRPATPVGLDVMHLCDSPVADVSLCGVDVSGFEYGVPGEWPRRTELDDETEVACGKCHEVTEARPHPSCRRVESAMDAGGATAASIIVGVRIRLEKWGETEVPSDAGEFRERVERAVHDAVVYWAAIHLCELDGSLRWQRLAGPYLHTDPCLRGLPGLPAMEEETAVMLLGAFAEGGPARSPFEFDRRRRESWTRSAVKLREAAGLPGIEDGHQITT